jgi:iron(III) transport system permease protein
MTSWRLAVTAILLGFIAAPLAFPFAELLSEPTAWHVWDEVGRLTLLAGTTGALVVGTLCLALPLGVIGAILLYRTDLPCRNFLSFLMVLTLFVPLPLFATAWQAALGDSGWWPMPIWATPAAMPNDVSWKPWAAGLLPAIWIHALAGLPWVVLIVGQGLLQVEKELEEDALTATSWPWVLLLVTLPRARASLVAAAVWVTVQCATEITVTDMMQVRTFAEEVYTQTVVGDQASLARSLVVALPSIVAFGLLATLTAGWLERELPSSSRTAKPLVLSLRRWRLAILGLTLVVVVPLVGVPLGSLVWRAGLSGTPAAWSMNEMTGHLGKVMRICGRMISETFTWALLAGLTTSTLALVTCWLMEGSRRFRQLVLTLAVVAWVIPGPVVGFGLLALIRHLITWTEWNVLARWLYFGPSYLPAAWVHVVRFFPFAVALLWPVVRLLPVSLRESHRVEGAGPGRELYDIIWPLCRGAWLTTAIVVGVLALGEVAASKAVATPGAETFAQQVFAQMHYGVTADLAALCLVLLLLVACGSSVVVVAGWRMKKAALSVDGPP